VIAAEDGEKAIREFVQHRDRIDLLVLDVIMPGKNGKEVYDEARRILPRIKAIFTSGYPEDLIARQGALAEGLNFIPKPSPINALLGKIREVLDV
jgi:CheY-like chemotaxis protein